MEEKISECVELVKPVLSHIPTVLVSLGEHGVLHCSATPKGGGDDATPSFLHYQAAADHLLPMRNVLSVSGAGDRYSAADNEVLVRVNPNSNPPLKRGHFHATPVIRTVTRCDLRGNPHMLSCKELWKLSKQ